MNTNYNETDYKNAQRIISECQKYIKDTVGKYQNNDAFPEVTDLVFAYENGGNSLRGRWKGFIALQCNKYVCHLTLHGKFSDGSGTYDGIEAYPSRYGQFNSEQRIIDIAVLLATRWDDIKSKVNEIITTYQKESSANSDILSSFTI